jgi:hypothetical protein
MLDRLLDLYYAYPIRFYLLALIFLLLMMVIAVMLPTKPTYQDMAEKTIIVQTGTTECHYVPAWEAVSCVTLPRTYGPEAPAVLLREIR